MGTFRDRKADISRPRVAAAIFGAFIYTAFAVAQAPAPARFSGRVVGVADGDTINVLRDGRTVRVRLDGIDCPEDGQDFSQRARNFTRVLVFDRTVEVNVLDVDQYGRLVARVRTGDQDVSVELVRAGLAWHFTRYSKDPVLAQLEREARTEKRGLWVQPNAIPPWTYRRPATQSTPRRLVSPTVRDGATIVYHGNVRSKALHGPSCQFYSCPNCTARFTSLAEAKAAGYRPHTGNGGCLTD
jgi:endonuclease YncB( thermonuclease family)